MSLPGRLLFIKRVRKVYFNHYGDLICYSKRFFAVKTVNLRLVTLRTLESFDHVYVELVFQQHWSPLSGKAYPNKQLPGYQVVQQRCTISLMRGNCLLYTSACPGNNIAHIFIINRADMIGKPRSGFGKDIEDEIYPSVLQFLNFIIIPGDCR